MATECHCQDCLAALEVPLTAEAAVEKIENFLGIPKILKEQIIELERRLDKNNPVYEDYARLKREVAKYTVRKWHGKHGPIRVSRTKDIHRLLLWSIIFNQFTALSVLQPEYLKCVQVYDQENRPIIQLEKFVSTHKSMKLLRGRFISKELQQQFPQCSPEKGGVLVKLYESRNLKKGTKMDTSYESNVYRRLGYPPPSLGVEGFLWNIPVLIMEPMEPIRTTDNPYEIGVQILPQLAKLHRFTVHSDLKPENIMKRLRPDGSGKWDFFLIDYGGCAKERLEHGYRRRTWTRRWTCQPRHGPIVTTPKHDLWELIRTLQAYKDRQVAATQKERARQATSSKNNNNNNNNKQAQMTAQPTRHHHHRRGSSSDSSSSTDSSSSKAASRWPKRDYDHVCDFKGRLKMCIDYVYSINETRCRDYHPHYRVIDYILRNNRFPNEDEDEGEDDNQHHGHNQVKKSCRETTTTTTTQSCRTCSNEKKQHQHDKNSSSKMNAQQLNHKGGDEEDKLRKKSAHHHHHHHHHRQGDHHASRNIK